jgi:iron-sulfur cluster repair protein YtfE (RIC family)
VEMKLKADKEKIDAERHRRIQIIKMKVEERMRRTEEIIFSKIKEEQIIKKKKKEKKVKEV